MQEEGNPEYERAYRKMFGDDRVSYTFEHGGILFIMLNNAGATIFDARVYTVAGGLMSYAGDDTDLMLLAAN